METQSPSLFAKALVVAGASLVLGLCFDYFFFGKLPGISFPIFIALVVVGLLVIGDVFNRPLDKKTYWLFIPLTFFSSMVFVRSSGLLTFMNIGASLLLLLLIARLSFARTLKSLVLNEYVKVMFLPFKFIRPFFSTVGDLIALRGLSKDQKVLSQIWKGIIMTVPVLIVFILLFSSADLVFHKYLTDLVNIEIEEETIGRAILIAIVTALFLGAYSYLFKKTEEAAPSTDKKSVSLGHIETSILLGSINVLFFMFILVQLTYLFGGETTIVDQGFTFAHYARRGFFELIAVAVISFLLLLGTEKYIMKKDDKHSVLFKVLSTALIVQVILVMASSFTRLSLYEAAYGFTTLRLYSHAFIIFLGVIFCVLMYKIFIDSRENTLAFRLFITVIAFVVGMNILNPDAFIAQRNVDRLKESGKLDPYYMSSLSADALPVSIQILDMPESEVTKEFARQLYWQTTHLQESPYQESAVNYHWQSSNLSRIKQQKILDSKSAQLEKYKDYETINNGVFF